MTNDKVPMTNELQVNPTVSSDLRFIGHWDLVIGISNHHLQEFIEQIMAVMRPGSGFGMVLNPEGRVDLMTNAFGSLVIQVDMSDFNVIGQSR